MEQQCSKLEAGAKQLREYVRVLKEQIATLGSNEIVFGQRVSALEEEKTSLKQTIDELRLQLEELRSDNDNLKGQNVGQSQAPATTAVDSARPVSWSIDDIRRPEFDPSPVPQLILEALRSHMQQWEEKYFDYATMRLGMACLGRKAVKKSSN